MAAGAVVVEAAAVAEEATAAVVVAAAVVAAMAAGAVVETAVSAARTVLAHVAAAVAVAAEEGTAVVAGMAVVAEDTDPSPRHHHPGENKGSNRSLFCALLLQPVPGQRQVALRRGLRGRPANALSNRALGSTRNTLATTPICHGITR